MPSISRRTLLQGTGAMAVVGSLSGLIPETAHAMNSLGAKPELLTSVLVRSSTTVACATVLTAA